MKKSILLAAGGLLLLASCQKNVTNTSDNTETGEIGESPLAYEVITTGGRWLAMWNNEEGDLVFSTNPSATHYDTITGNWQYTFEPKTQPYQMLVSLSPEFYTLPAPTATINFYKQGELVKTITKKADEGHTLLFYDALTDTLKSSNSFPVLTYEVIVDADSSDMRGDWNTWFGTWINKKGVKNWTGDSTQGNTVLPNGWRYSFIPDHLPFEMFVEATAASVLFGTDKSPETIINFYENGVLVKSAKSNWAKGETTLTYHVQ